MEGYDSLRDYLKQSGVLATGDAAAIALAKREYRKAYMRQYKRKRRKVCEIVLSVDAREYKELEELAKNHGYSVPKFLLHLADVHREKMPIVQHPDRFNELHLLLRQIYSEVVFIVDNSRSDVVPKEVRELEGMILRLDKELKELSHVRNLESHINGLVEIDSDKVYGILRRIVSEENEKG